MSWFRIEHKLPSHGKVAPLSDAAFRLHITAGCWCAEHMTDGVIPEAMPEAMTKAPRGKALKSVLAELLSARLWEDIEGGYLLHDYLDYNMSRAEYETKRSAGRAGGERSGESRRSKTEAPASNVLEQVPKQNRSTSSRSPQAVSVSVSVSEDPKVLKLDPTRESARVRPISRARPESSASARPLGEGEQERPEKADARQVISSVPEPKSPPNGWDGSEDETVCPINLLERARELGVFTEMADKLRCSVPQLEHGTREFMSYWTIGGGSGQKRRHWMRKLREHLRRAAEGDKLRPPGAIAHDSGGQFTPDGLDVDALMAAVTGRAVAQ